MEPSGEAAKNKRSVMSQTVEDMGLGKWKVVNKDWEDRSQSLMGRR